MTDKKVSMCPVCASSPDAAATLVPHCGSPTCSWYSCRNKKCDAVLDLKRRRGHAIGPDPAVRRQVTL